MKLFISHHDKKPGLKPWVYRLLSILFWLALWQIASLAVGYEFLLASPLRVLESLLRLLLSGQTYRIALYSTLRIILGFLAAACAGIGLAALAYRSHLLRQFVEPLVATARSVPVASFVILAIILVSPRRLSVLISFIIGFPVVYSNTLEGIVQGSRQLREMAWLFGVPFGRRLRGIYLPEVLPYLRSGLTIALGLCWKSGIAAEVIGIPRGSIGEKLYSVKVNYYTADLFAWTIIIVLLSLLCIRLLHLFIRGLSKSLVRL